MNGWPLKIGDKYAALRRVASKDDIRSNIHAGGTAEAVEIGKTELKVAELIRPKLIADGMFLVGIDIVGDKILEVNVFSPGNLQRCSVLAGENFAVPVIECDRAKARDRRAISPARSTIGRWPACRLAWLQRAGHGGRSSSSAQADRGFPLPGSAKTALRARAVPRRQGSSASNPANPRPDALQYLHFPGGAPIDCSGLPGRASVRTGAIQHIEIKGSPACVLVLSSLSPALASRPPPPTRHHRPPWHPSKKPKRIRTRSSAGGCR